MHVTGISSCRLVDVSNISTSTCTRSLFASIVVATFERAVRYTTTHATSVANSSSLDVPSERQATSPYESGADAPVRRCEGLVVEGTRRGRGRPKKYWGEVIRQDLAQLHLTEDMTLDRKEWRSRIKVEDILYYIRIYQKPVAASLQELVRLLVIGEHFSVLHFRQQHFPMPMHTAPRHILPASCNRRWYALMRIHRCIDRHNKD
ncbi:hypothetical protein H5410_053591 [Solanum commersonii]|uniref:Uncharacterized protein n=1 Tax=Solanum commersonii TaxID=4109 RepID=A0A9J5X6S5_SOLCO|nr:hypothetical protein H5410_053591 [Solanum commersonii]